MPPVPLRDMVTRVCAMRKTATVTVSRWVIREQTGKVCLPSFCRVSNQGYLQRIERNKKHPTHDENDGVSYFRSSCSPSGERPSPDPNLCSDIGSKTFHLGSDYSQSGDSARARAQECWDWLLGALRIVPLKVFCRCSCRLMCIHHSSADGRRSACGAPN